MTRVIVAMRWARLPSSGNGKGGVLDGLMLLPGNLVLWYMDSFLYPGQLYSGTSVIVQLLSPSKHTNISSTMHYK